MIKLHGKILINREFWKDKSVLITGHTGFVGSWLSLYLKMLDTNLTGYALAPPTTPNLFELVNVSENMVSVIADIRDYNTVLNVMNKYKPNIIIHLAAQPLVRYSYQNPIETYSTNVLGTVNLLEAVRQTKFTGAFLNVTSDKCYHNKEWVWGYREADLLGGNDPYSNSKACSELVTQAFRDSYFKPENYDNHKVAISSARAGNIIGGGDWADDRLIPDCIRSFLKKKKVIIRSPNSTRPWQHVLEPISGYLLLAEKLYTDGQKFSQPFNFGPTDYSNKSVSWVVEYITNLWGNEASWGLDIGNNVHEAKYLNLDCTKAIEQLGWSPKWDIKTALKKTVEWYEMYYTHPNLINEITHKQISEYFNNY